MTEVARTARRSHGRRRQSRQHDRLDRLGVPECQIPALHGALLPQRAGQGPQIEAFAGCGHAQRHPRHGVARQIQIDPLVEGDRVAVATSLSVAGHAWLHQQPLALVVVAGCNLVRQRGAWAHDAHPFCQDEKTRLPAEMLFLDSLTICFLAFEPPDFCSSFRPSLTMNQPRKAAFKSNGESSHWGGFPMGQFFASTSTHTQTQRFSETPNLNESQDLETSKSDTGLTRS